jgi:hypothetical protein
VGKGAAGQLSSPSARSKQGCLSNMTFLGLVKAKCIPCRANVKQCSCCFKAEKNSVVGKCEESLFLDLFFKTSVVGERVKKINYVVNSEP